ncbi:SURF1 family protein [Shewanella sp. MBTL60-007]|uniref:SURF1 family protein n=1 Tax=Shewanella sp. MBTL60-007 TaxID=2815911 RepID=UPI001BBE93E9|nr:SURF1 family protein [Shewanella sp. MBTL60-007]GIU25812.1 SURF1-like protein [Shewanella sp. MBTL60-007]
MALPRVKIKLAWLFIVLVTVIVFSTLVKLGFWQLERAQFKARWQQELNNRQSSSVLSYNELLKLAIDEPATGFKLQVMVTPQSEQIFLLDNQIYNGQVGYLAYQALTVNENTPWLLVELGFIPASLDRSQLPEVQTIMQPLLLQGRVYQKQLNPMSSELMAEEGQPTRIQNLNLPQLAQLVGQPLAPAVLQPNNLNNPYPHPWQPIPLSSQKHHGYAVQWFSMALVFAVLMGYLVLRKLKKTETEHSHKPIANNSETL